MTENFEKALAFVLSWEGGYTDDPNDPGGETNYGISKRAYPNEDIKDMTRERAAEIYRRDYWKAAGCDSLPYPMDCIMFDCAVNQGVYKAKKILELSDKPVDFLINRLKVYSDIAKKHPAFLRGWLNRVLALYTVISKNGGAV